MSWKGMFAYAFPPFAILPRVLQKIRTEQCLIILVAPFWPRQSWFPSILDLLVEKPVRIPVSEHLLTQSTIHKQPRNFPVGCMEIVKQQFIEKGFSSETAERAASCRQPSTYRTYNTRVRSFMAWAKGRKVDYMQASIGEVAEFLNYLFTVRNLAVSTINGYRAAISLVHKSWNGVSVCQSKDLSDLVNAFFISRPPVRRLLPPWSLSLVLDKLLRQPFEPLKKAKLKFLTWKTVFLVAAASGRRQSCIHALTTEEGHIRWDQTGVTLIPHPGFLAKNESVHYMSKAVFLPYIHQVSSQVEDRAWCPCRALQFYLAATKKFRSGSGQLFLTYQEGNRKAASRDMVSRWITALIRWAYENSVEGDLKAYKIRAHDVRALSASWALFKGVSMAEIMEAASWSTASTFSSFYLKDVAKERGTFARAVLS
ncbi:hypothetical protein HOLleu_05698 [Holothuria leucospilota]|uniref:Integrase SAM-like N-terminal domain-containing protein n=1 Tax=Holothuria leucospilota TaxID=206669 RepID=A0A9Q1HEP7_HOLLE|nr:hypothetical protein HOLleu_05698 [Holothuria leucospilota]